MLCSCLVGLLPAAFFMPKNERGTSMNTNYFCTRPKLAERLIRNGRQPEVLPNLWRPDLSAWKFTLDDQLAREVLTYYQGIGKPIPDSIISYIYKRKTEGEWHD